MPDIGQPSDTMPAAPNTTRWWEQRLDWVMFAAVLLTIPAFYLELAGAEPMWQRAGSVVYFVVWATFSGYLYWLWRRNRHHIRFLARHWLDALVAIGAGINLTGSYGNWSSTEWVLRLAYVAIVLARILLSLRIIFSPHGIVYVLALGAATLGFAGAGFYWLEPTVHSYADGLWLAFVSGATVGYGDFVPTTPASRMFAVFMVLLGYAVLSMVTATIAAIFIGEDEKAMRRELHGDIKRLREEVAALRDELRTNRRRDNGPG